jgi:rfaE bifunctional protein nucleotidyltransferase chain/domain
MSVSKIYYDHRDIRSKFGILTNGCFDVIHVGHLRLLQKAAEYKTCATNSAKLIVAVNDNDSVESLKGIGRPINPIMDRMEMLAGLECVDFVVPFTGNNVARVIRELWPKHWIKGAPYTIETLNQEEVAAAKSVGANIVILPKFGDYSTTAILERMKR